ncbi:MAG: hypothetical protein HXX11_16195 [Desulfuromonadales bacterium]|nr:hypothetical protein [Desulfuromonadales bacterium]
MNLVDALLESIEARDETVKNVLVGLHWIGVESRFSAGMAHVSKGGEGLALKDAGAILGRNTREIAARLRSWAALDACLGLAALCSLIEPEGDPVNVNEYILSNAPGRVVTCIGRFPFYPKVQRVAKWSYLLEMNPRPRELPLSAAEEVIPKSDLVVINSTTLINKSLQRLLELSRGKTCVVLGPCTPMSDVLFDFGATVIAGVRVVDPHRLFLSLAQGVMLFRDIQGIQSIARFRDRQNRWKE